MGSERSYRETSVAFRRFTVMRRQMSAGGTLQGALGGETENPKDAESADDAKNAENRKNESATLQDWQNRMQPAGSNGAIRNSASQTMENIRQTTIRYIFELLFSYRRNGFNRWFQGSGADMSRSSQSNGNQADINQANANSANGEAYYGDITGNGQGKPLAANVRVLTYSSEVLQIEKEETSFSTVGTVRTGDGREIHFNVNVGMSREFQQYYQESRQVAFTFCDPLVINLDTDIAEMSDQTFYFDIDADGELDEISGLGAGSGYLALDKNNDGVINDGSELFGTASGNGFADLAKYDQDGNGWIDENDEIWNKLKIWCKDENGRDVLYKLSEKGVGAICLKNVSTDYTLKNQEGRTTGAIRSSGVFLYEDGGAGTVQHVDVAKYSARA